MNNFSHSIKVEGITEEHIKEQRKFHEALVRTQEQTIARLFMITDGKAHYDWRGRFKMGRESLISRFMSRRFS